MSRPPPRIARAPLLAAAVCLAGFGRCATPASNDYPTGPWQLVWSDEFDGPALQPPDTSRWTYDVGGSGWGNNQLEYDTARPENVSLDGNGHLAIVALKETYQGTDGVTRGFTSARIKTQGLATWTYGRFVASIKLPAGQGLWPAFWLLGNDFTTVGWPACGEIDVMEYKGQDTHWVQGTGHVPRPSGGGTEDVAIYGDSSLPDTGPGFDGAFHVFAIDWDPGVIRWEVDGNVYFTVDRTRLPAGTTWVFDHPFFVILNLAVGGDWVGAPGGTTPFPATMLVDYVRVYARGS